MADLLISPEKEADFAKTQPQYEPDEETKKRVSEIKTKFEERQKVKVAYERTWFVNGCFLDGQQNVTYNDLHRNFEIPFRVPQHRVRYSPNLCMSYARRTKARLTANRPGLFVRPASTDETDVDRARNQDKVLESEFERMDHYAKFKNGISWLIMTGHFYYSLKWNPKLGPVVMEDKPVTDQYTGEQQIHPETGEPMTEKVPAVGEDGQPLHMGENELEIANGFEISIDGDATSDVEPAWLIRSRVRTLEWVRENYPKFGKYVKASRGVMLHNLYEKRLKNIAGAMGQTGEWGESEEKDDSRHDRAVVHEYWERPTTQYPQGRCIVIAGDVEVWNGPNPYKHAQFPYVIVQEIMVPGRYMPMSVMEHLVQIQKNYNRGRSQEIENRTLIGRPKWLVPKVCKVKQGSFDSEPGEKIEYISGPRGERPELIQPQSTSQATMNEIQQTVTDFQEVSSSHEVSRGILPSANIPAEGISKLQMSDEMSLGDTASNVDIAHQKLARMCLMNCSQFWTEERMVRAGGEFARLEAMRLRGDDLAGDDVTANYADVRCIPRSTLYKDPVKQKEQVDWMIKNMILDPIQHRDRILKMLDQQDLDELFAEQRMDEQYAGRENETMQAGQPSMPRDFEDHGIHIRIHNRFRKSEKYRRLPPQLAQIYDQHVAMHEQLMVQTAQKQTMMQMMATPQGMMGGQPGGGPPPPGGAGGPPPPHGPSGGPPPGQ